MSGPHGPTLENYVTLFTDATMIRPFLITLGSSAAVAVLCVLVAVPMGWCVARTDMPLRRSVRILVMASLVTPPFLGAIAWELLAAPNTGFLNQLARVTFGLDRSVHPFNVYSVAGLTFVNFLYTFPYAFVFVANALERIPADLEDAVNDCTELGTFSFCRGVGCIEPELEHALKSAATEKTDRTRKITRIVFIPLRSSRRAS